MSKARQPTIAPSRKGGTFAVLGMVGILVLSEIAHAVDTTTTENKHGHFLFRYFPKATAHYFVRFDGRVVTRANGSQVTCEPGESKTVRVRSGDDHVEKTMSYSNRQVLRVRMRAVQTRTCVGSAIPKERRSARR